MASLHCAPIIHALGPQAVARLLAIQKVTATQLAEMVAAEGIPARIQRASLTPVVQAEDPSKAIPGGLSQIISYYDGGRYVCTFHRLLDANGQQTDHFHPKDAVIEDERYRDP